MLKTIIKPFLDKFIEHIDANNIWWAYGYLAGTVVVIFGLGYCLAWYLQNKKLQREVEKIGLESKEKATSLLKTLQEKRNTYNDQAILIQLSVKLCIESLSKQDEGGLKKNRDELMDLFFNYLVKDFVEYLEVCEVFYSGWQKKINASIEDEVLPFLQTIQVFQDTVNNQNILGILEAEGSNLKKFTIMPILRFVDNNLRFYQIILRYKCKKQIKKIKFKNAT